MKTIRQMYVEHKHHILGAFALAAAIFLALCGAQNLGIGGINLDLRLLAVGLFTNKSRSSSRSRTLRPPLPNRSSNPVDP